MSESDLHPKARKYLAHLRISYVMEGRRLGLYIQKDLETERVEKLDNPSQKDLDILIALDIALAELKTINLIEE